VNHTRLPKEVHQPDSAHRCEHGKKGDCVERGDLHLNAAYNYPRINVYKRPGDGKQLQPKRTVINKLITGVACD